MLSGPVTLAARSWGIHNAAAIARPVFARPCCVGAVGQRRARCPLRGPTCAVPDGRQPPDEAAIPAAPPEVDKEVFVTSAGKVEEVEEEDAQYDFLGETTEGSLHFTQRAQQRSGGVTGLFGLQTLEGIVTADLEQVQDAVQDVLDSLGVPADHAFHHPDRAVYCSRTLNLRSIKCIGYDLDYTLIHYDVEAWEGRAYEYGLEALRQMGVPVDGLRFDSSLVIRGLIIDRELGNLIKVDRFGLVKRAMHGTRMLSWQEIRGAYGREVVNLRHDGRWVFLNTLFSISEAVLFAQLVDRLDQGAFGYGAGGSQLTYQGLYKMVAKACYSTHVEGKLKGEIIRHPERFVEPDPDMAHTLLDQRDSGKMLLLITNSDFQYTSTMMSYTYDRFLPEGMTWRSLFDMVIVQSRKPDFFSYNMSLYEVVTEDGLMRPALAAKRGGLYCGGSARMVEKALGVQGDDILYVGDHIYTDAALAKINFRWRTALILRELEQEVDALARGRPHRAKLKELMAKKEAVGLLFDHLRLARQRSLAGRPAGMSGQSITRPASPSSQASMEALLQDEAAVNETLGQLLFVIDQLDARIGPMLEQDGAHFSRRWGFLSRAGLNDKSQLCRQIEKYADVYTSRVSNFMRYTPYAYFRSPSQSLAHDRGLTDYYERVLRGRDSAAELEGVLKADLLTEDHASDEDSWQGGGTVAGGAATESGSSGGSGARGRRGQGSSPVAR